MIPLTITDVRAVPGDSAFLIDDGQTAVLYDTGFGFTGYAVAENIQKVLKDRPLDYILLSHSHYDHALGSAYIRRQYPDTKIVAGAYAQSIFRKPTAQAVMGDLDRKAAAGYGITEYEDLSGELWADISVVDGEIIHCGAMAFTAVDLPGHTKCSVGYYLAENRLLLATETLSIYFGGDAMMASFLVGYQMTLESIDKARQLDIQQILLPHYGVISGEMAENYLDAGERITRDTASLILEQLRAGKTTEEILTILTDRFYREQVRPTYPYDAFHMNSEIMIRLIRKELLSET